MDLKECSGRQKEKVVEGGQERTKRKKRKVQSTKRKVKMKFYCPESRFLLWGLTSLQILVCLTYEHFQFIEYTSCHQLIIICHLDMRVTVEIAS